MLRSLRFVPLVALGSTVLAGGCAEGTKVDMGLASSGTTSATTGGSVSVAKGGASASGGKSSLLTNGGAMMTSTQGTAGKIGSSFGGGTATGSGGTLSTAGAASATGGATVSTVPPPTGGLGITMTSAQLVTQNNIQSVMVLVNQSTQAVDLLTVKIRYYFTIDTWTTPVLDTYYIGPDTTKDNMKSEFFTVALPDADRYVEMSFIATTAIGAPTLKASSQLELKTGLHDQSWATPNTSNDYSFTGPLVGFTDRVTVHVSGALVWGVEPGSIPSSGAGGSGAAGAAGAAGAESAGSGSGTGASNGGAAGANGSGGMSNAGAAGITESAGSAGMQSAGTAGGL